MRLLEEQAAWVRIGYVTGQAAGVYGTDFTVARLRRPGIKVGCNKPSAEEGVVNTEGKCKGEIHFNCFQFLLHPLHSSLPPIPWWLLPETVMWSYFYCVFTYIYSLLIDKDVCESKPIN